MIGQYIGNFIPDSLSHQIRKCNEDYLGLTMTISELEMTRRDVTSQIRNMTKEFHANRRDAVGFMDFVYYSICVSTTVSFGDIAPNNGLTRTVAIIELLLCIILVGAIVDRIIKSGFDGVEVASSGVDDHLTIFLTDESKADEIKSFISEKTGLNQTAFRTLVINEIPKNDSGKVLYKELDKFINDGELNGI